MTHSLLKTTLICAAAGILSACASYSSQPAQSVTLIEPSNGAVVSSPFKVKFGVTGMKVEPAGEIIANTGHHHLLINMGAVTANEAIPFTSKHIHFGKGQVEAEVKLDPGAYTITAQFANGEHQSYGKPMSHTIQITVK